MSSVRDSTESTSSESSGISMKTTVNANPLPARPSIPPRRMTTPTTPSASTATLPERSAQFVRGRGFARPMDEHCTHITMTRIFTDDYHCSKCFQPPSNGWLWRCTQDRELTLENDEDKNCLERFDALSDIFGQAKKPLTRSPTARKNPLSFFDEVSFEQLRTYSAEQIDTILAQRKHLLDVAQRANTREFRNPFPNSVDPTLAMAYFPRSAIKPWLPILGGECQTKFCHSCWPHGEARSYLSINGIVNGDLPREAIHGLSFILKRERTVHDAKVVANLGLRRNPTTTGLLRSPTSLKRSLRLAQLETISLALKPPQGPGLSSLLQAGPSKSSTHPGCRRIKQRPQIQRKPTKYPSKRLPPSRLTPFSPVNGSFPPLLPYPPSPRLARRHSFDILPDVPLPEQTEEEIYLISPTLSYADYLRFEARKSPSIAARAGNNPSSFAPGSLTSMEEVDITDVRPTELITMEKEEVLNGEEIGAFGVEPLQVDDGVALLEESMENHIPDFMMQY